jgi:hypothetical protein
MSRDFNRKIIIIRARRGMQQIALYTARKGANISGIQKEKMNPR